MLENTILKIQRNTTLHIDKEESQTITTQAERPDSLTQSKPNLHMVLLHSAQHF